MNRADAMNTLLIEPTPQCRFMAEIACPRPGSSSPWECGGCAMLDDIDDPALLREVIKGCFRVMGEREEGLRQEQEAFARDFAGISTVVAQLCQGDPQVRMTPENGSMVLDHLAVMLNQLAGTMQEMIDDSHEMAIGLCEHYDTLNRLASGDFEARAPVDSPNELIAKLGMLINREAEVMVSTIAELQRTDNELKSAYQQLIQAQKMEAIGQLAGGVAHDFNNILTAITGYSHLLLNRSREDHGDRQIQRYASQILIAAEKAGTLTKDLLTFSRKQIMNLSPIDLNEVIASIGDMLARLIGEDIDLRIELHNGPLIVLVDVGQIQQVVMNLVTNARDAMPCGGAISIITSVIHRPRIETAGDNQAAPGRYAVLSVQDNGMGMDQKVSERMFEPFFTTKEIGKGTGLGLSIVYGIITQHNGFVEVQSAMGQGTTISAHLPLADNPAERPRGDIPASIPFDQGGSETLLLAEDNAAAREVLRDILEGAGYTVLCAVDGADAVQLFTQHADRIRMVVLDVIMPKKNGSQVLHEIRTLRPDVRYLFLSGYIADVINGKDDLETELHFLSKPVPPNALLSKVREILDDTEK